MPIDYANLQSYLESKVPPRHPELAEMESNAKQTDFPILGPASCQFCYLLARLIVATKVFELGSGYGYSTAWFAKAVEENGGGIVHHTVWDQGLSDMAKIHLGMLGYGDNSSQSSVSILYTMGEAVQALKDTPGPFDIIFNDIDKDAYPDTIPVVFEKLRPGGLFITDNVIWSGRVCDPDQDETTKRITSFTDQLMSSNDWICSIVPIRDGLLIATKK